MSFLGKIATLLPCSDDSCTLYRFLYDHETAVICTISILALVALVYIASRAIRLMEAPIQRWRDLAAAKRAAQIADKTTKNLAEADACLKSIEGKIVNASIAANKSGADEMLGMRFKWLSCDNERTGAYIELAKAHCTISHLHRAVEDARAQRKAVIEQCVEACTKAKLEQQETAELLRRKDAELASSEERNKELEERCRELERTRRRTEELLKKAIREKDELLKKTTKEREELQRAVLRKNRGGLNDTLEAFFEEGSGSVQPSL